MNKAYLLQVLLTQDQRSPSDVNVFFLAAIIYIEIYIYTYMYIDMISAYIL